MLYQLAYAELAANGTTPEPQAALAAANRMAITLKMVAEGSQPPQFSDFVTNVLVADFDDDDNDGATTFDTLDSALQTTLAQQLFGASVSALSPTQKSIAAKYNADLSGASN